MIIAKPIIKNEFWILQKNQEKIGNIESKNNIFTITIGNRKFVANNLQSLKKNNIVFEKVTVNRPCAITQVYGYPTDCLAYNPIWDVKKRIPLFTKRKKSRCWFAAGWYKIYQKDQWQIVQNPKLISIKRNRYLGPYHDKQSASLAEAQSIEDTL